MLRCAKSSKCPAAGKTTTTIAKYGKDSIECLISAGSGSSTKIIPIPAGANMVGDAMFAILDSTPKVGTEYKLNYFNPLTLTIDDLKIKVEKTEKSDG